MNKINKKIIAFSQSMSSSLDQLLEVFSKKMEAVKDEITSEIAEDQTELTKILFKKLCELENHIKSAPSNNKGSENAGIISVTKELREKMKALEQDWKELSSQRKVFEQFLSEADSKQANLNKLIEKNISRLKTKEERLQKREAGLNQEAKEIENSRVQGGDADELELREDLLKEEQESLAKEKEDIKKQRALIKARLQKKQNALLAQKKKQEESLKKRTDLIKQKEQELQKATLYLESERMRLSKKEQALKNQETELKSYQMAVQLQGEEVFNKKLDLLAIEFTKGEPLSWEKTPKYGYAQKAAKLKISLKTDWMCPIWQRPMYDAVMLSSGILISDEAAKQMYQVDCRTECPVTRKKVSHITVVYQIRTEIRAAIEKQIKRLELLQKSDAETIFKAGEADYLRGIITQEDYHHVPQLFSLAIKKAGSYSRCVKECLKSVKNPLNGESLLHVAAGKGEVSVTKALIKLGADIFQTDQKGHTAKKTAAINNQEGIVTYLEGVEKELRGGTVEIKETEKKVEAVSAATVSQVIEQIGETYEVTLSGNRRTKASMITLAGIRNLGINLNTVFRGCGGKKVFNEGTDVNKHGILVNLDFYQQTALLRAICEKVPAIANQIGFYNLRASRKVYEVFDREKVCDKKGIWWFYTGEKWVHGKKEDDYQEEGLVRANEIDGIKGSRFCDRNVHDGGWNYDDPEACHYSSAPVVGGFI